MKICTKCLKNKMLHEFHKSTGRGDGYRPQCKDCVNLSQKIWRKNNIESFKLRRKKYYQKNINKMRDEKRKYYRNNIEKKKTYDILYRKKNKDKIKQYKRDWEQLHKNDPIVKIKRNLRRRIHHLLNGRKSMHTFELIGCTAEEFKAYIESKFLSGMSWDNYGINGWHIDHIIPCYKFDLTNIEEQKRCFHYSNQRPLWAKDNLSRSRNI